MIYTVNKGIVDDTLRLKTFYEEKVQPMYINRYE